MLSRESPEPGVLGGLETNEAAEVQENTIGFGFPSLWILLSENGYFLAIDAINSKTWEWMELALLYI